MYIFQRALVFSSNMSTPLEFMRYPVNHARVNFLAQQNIGNPDLNLGVAMFIDADNVPGNTGILANIIRTNSPPREDIKPLTPLETHFKAYWASNISNTMPCRMGLRDVFIDCTRSMFLEQSADEALMVKLYEYLFKTSTIHKERCAFDPLAKTKVTIVLATADRGLTKEFHRMIVEIQRLPDHIDVFFQVWSFPQVSRQMIHHMIFDDEHIDKDDEDQQAILNANEFLKNSIFGNNVYPLYKLSSKPEYEPPPVFEAKVIKWEKLYEYMYAMASKQWSGAFVFPKEPKPPDRSPSPSVQTPPMLSPVPERKGSLPLNPPSKKRRTGSLHL